ncbi:MAG TPA: CocE/NonD family hydrolase, partial [Ktedonobacteraceae bacterium]|nr:CocE/NonD family hydrolase [Ktedonobacteraceae bacterium]
MQSQHLSLPTYAIHVERQIPIPMTDGTILRADVYRPKASGRYPVLVERVAYALEDRCRYFGEYYASRGYVVVGQNVRGRFVSDGVFAPFRDDGWGERRDGYETIRWAGTQPWSNGAVGMLDGSYSAGTQYLVAPTRPPFLKALFAREGLSNIYRDFVFRGGAYQLRQHREWTIENELAVVQALPSSPEKERLQARLQQALDDMDRWYRHLPLHSCPPLEGLAPWYFEDLRHPEDGPYWWPMNLAHMFHEVETPIFHLGGWFDLFLDSTLRCFQGIQTHGKTETCRTQQRLMIGPWIHGPDQIGQSAVGELDFGPEAAFDLFASRLQWYDYWLKGMDNGVMESAPVHLFLMGANRWLDAPTWPLPDITSQPVYLQHGTGRTEASLNHGKLTFERPSEEEPAERF